MVKLYVIDLKLAMEVEYSNTMQMVKDSVRCEMLRLVKKLVQQKFLLEVFLKHLHGLMVQRQDQLEYYLELE
jgi:hypothetical protein